MKEHQQQATIGLLGAITIALLLAGLWHRPEPVCQGKRLSQWINDLPRGGVAGFGSLPGWTGSHPGWLEMYDAGITKDQYAQAKEAVLQMRETAIPYSLGLMHTKDPWW